jgi:hypothetical protein
MVSELLDNSEDLSEEDEDIAIRYPQFTGSKTWRLSFFSKPISDPRDLVDTDNDDFLGYAIVRQVNLPGIREVPWIFESVIRPIRHENNFIHGTKIWNCSVAGYVYSIDGPLYAQQNDMTNCCAHVALRTAAVCYHSAGDMTYREMNSIVGVDHRTKKIGGADGRGLSSNEMVTILEHIGAKCFVGAYVGINSGFTPPPFQKYIYGSIESGNPAIVFFGTMEKDSFHVIPIHGHTFNEDTWVPSAESEYFKVGDNTQYIPSDSWVSMFIGHDDNFGSNYCIPRHYLRTPSRKMMQDTAKTNELLKGKVAYVIGTIPAGIKTDPIKAEVIGADYLFSIRRQLPDDGNLWVRRLAFFADESLMVLRPVLIDFADYMTHLKSAEGWLGDKVKPEWFEALKFFEDLGDIWMIELSVPELFSANRRKVGEVLVRADIAPGTGRNMKSFILARLPGYFVLYEKGGATNPQYSFIPSGVPDHIKLFNQEGYI